MNNEQDFIEDNNNNNNLNNNFNTLPSSTFTLSLPCCAAFTISHARLIRIQQIFLICACILLLFESTGCSPLINTPSSAWHCEVWAGVALFISCVFIVEQILTAALLRRRFLRSTWRRVDLVLCILMFVAQVLCTSIDWIYSSSSRFLLIPRIFIILRLFINFRMTRVVIQSLHRILGPTCRYLAVLGCLYFFYGVLGVCWFQGLISPQDPRLLDTPYGLSGYWANNFDSFGSALIVLFEVMLINNFFITMDAYVLVTTVWTRLYFISFICISVYIYLNLFTGFILEGFLRSYEAISSKKTFEESLQLRIDQATQRMFHRKTGSHQPPPQRWHADFHPQLLDLYLDIFHLKSTQLPQDLTRQNN